MKNALERLERPRLYSRRLGIDRGLWVAVSAATLLIVSMLCNSLAATNEPRLNLQPHLVPIIVVTNVVLTNVVVTRAVFTNAVFTDGKGRSASFTGLIVAACGALFGAFTAYLADYIKEWRRTRNERHGAIVRTQLALSGQLNTVSNIQQQFLAPLRDDPERDKKLIRFTMQRTGLCVAYDSISFLLMTNHANLVLDVHSAEQSYRSAMEALDSRNQAFDRFHANLRLDGFDPNTGQCTGVPKDPRDLKLLKDTTDNLYRAVDKASERLALQAKELEKAGKSLYPKREFLPNAGERQDTPQAR
jgi:hypothetical protein